MKPWYLSKTIWTNIALTIAGLGVLVGSTTSIPTNIAVNIDTALAIAGGLVNLALRVWFTDQPIGPTPPAAK